MPPVWKANPGLRLAADFAGAAAWLAARRPGIRFVAPMANEAARELFTGALAAHAPGVEVQLLDGQTQRALVAADAVLVASGTATLETLLCKRPMVVAYRLGALTAPKYFLVPSDLEMTALQALMSVGEANSADAGENPMAEGNDRSSRLASAQDRVIVVDLWTDTKSWAALADPKLYPSIGLGFRYGRQPEIFSVASPTAGLMFSNDVMPVKVRFFFACGPMGWNGLYKHNVS